MIKKYKVTVELLVENKTYYIESYSEIQALNTILKLPELTDLERYSINITVLNELPRVIINDYEN